MTAILLDTAAYSAFMRGHADIKVALQRPDRIALTPIVLGELRAGFRQGGHRRKHEAELARFLASPRVEVLTIDTETSERYAAIVAALRTQGTPIPTNDIWIAASAMQYGLRVLTTDAHYHHVGQVLVEVCEP